MATAVYMDYQTGHTELTRSLCSSFPEGPEEGLRLLEQSCESLVSQDAENKKLVLDQVCVHFKRFVSTPCYNHAG